MQPNFGLRRTKSAVSQAMNCKRLVRVWLLGAWLGRDAVGAVAFDADTAQNAAEDGEADAGNEEDNAAGEAAGEVRVQEDGNARVDEHGEDVAEGASRHGVPPCKNHNEARGPSLEDRKSTRLNSSH